MKISIYQHDAWAGSGKVVDGRIVDCAARLGSTDEESEAAYEAIEDQISDGEVAGNIPGGISWIVD